MAYIGLYRVIWGLFLYFLTFYRVIWGVYGIIYGYMGVISFF